MIKPHYKTCENWVPDETQMTDADKKYRDLPFCANEGKHERCIFCAARKVYGRAPTFRWGKTFTPVL